jgi:hypothetical protein
VWRQDFLPPLEERLVQILERQDEWFRALVKAQLGHKEVRVPGQITIPRPGQRDGKPERKKVETDVAKIARFFSQV